MAEVGDNPSQETMIEERQELMISPLGGQSTLRTAHFLKPSFSSASVENPPPYPLASNLPISGNNELPLKVKFSGRRYKLEMWASWVNQLLPTYRPVWKKAGILEAILTSTYPIIRRKNLVIDLAEKWNCKTNTFVFPWGETTLTLEDMRVLGGFSILGYPVRGSPALSPEETREMSEIEQGLCLAEREIRNNGEKQNNWMKRFMGSGHILEHEAFLALWLARYVLPSGYEIDSSKIFTLAIRLSRGTRFALAPAVLASIYRDLSILKKSMVSSSLDLSDSEIEQGARTTVQLWAPFQLVLMWVWERFPMLRPSPKSIELGEPRSARWKGLEDSFRVRNVRRVLDSAGDRFQWRPYTPALNNWRFKNFYRETNELVEVNRGMDRESASFVICIRVGELVGLDCIEQYLPHRVSMQFGYDQDVPGGDVPRFNRSFEEAWRNYCRPVRDDALHIPARQFQSDVTARYLSWRVSSEVASKDVFRNGIARKPRSVTRRRQPRACYQALIVHEEDGTPIAESSHRKKTTGGDIGLMTGDDDDEPEELSTLEIVVGLNQTDPPQFVLEGPCLVETVTAGLNPSSEAANKNGEAFNYGVTNLIRADPPQLSVSEGLSTPGDANIGSSSSSTATKFFTVLNNLRASIQARSANLDEAIDDLKQEIQAFKN